MSFVLEYKEYVSPASQSNPGYKVPDDGLSLAELFDQTVSSQENLTVRPSTCMAINLNTPAALPQN